MFTLAWTQRRALGLGFAELFSTTLQTSGFLRTDASIRPRFERATGASGNTERLGPERLEQPAACLHRYEHCPKSENKAGFGLREINAATARLSGWEDRCMRG